MSDTLDQAVRALIHRIPGGDRHVPLEALRTRPIRTLEQCLLCPSIEVGIAGVYLPQEGSPVQQILIYNFCPVHKDDPVRRDALEIERLVTEADAARPHVYSVLRGVVTA